MTQKSPSEMGQSNPSTSVGSSVSSSAANPKDGIQAVARELKDDVTHIAKDFAGEAKKAAETKVGAGKDFAAEQLGSVADALRKTSKHLQMSDSPVTEYVEKAANSVEGISHYFQTRTLSQLIGDVERYARREPAIFLGGAFFAGLLGGRFLKAATPAPASNSTDRTHQGSGARALPAHTSSSNHGSSASRQNQNHNGDRHESRGGKNNQGQDRSENNSVSTGSAGGGSSSAKDASKSASGGGSGGKSDDASNRGGKGSGVS